MVKCFEVHGEEIHGFVYCQKCEYTAEDKSIMKQHMKRHTGDIPFVCNVCEFEATKQSVLMIIKKPSIKSSQKSSVHQSLHAFQLRTVPKVIGSLTPFSDQLPDNTQPFDKDC